MSAPDELTAHEAQAWIGFLRAHAALVRDVDKELRRTHGIPLSWYSVLHEVAAAGGRVRMGDLAAKVMLTRAGLSGLVDRLERAGLVERRTLDGDARARYAVLTGDGLHRLERARGTYGDAIRRCYTDRLTQEQLEQLGAVWRRLHAG